MGSVPYTESLLLAVPDHSTRNAEEISHEFRKLGFNLVCSGFPDYRVIVQVYPPPPSLIVPHAIKEAR